MRITDDSDNAQGYFLEFPDVVTNQQIKDTAKAMLDNLQQIAKDQKRADKIAARIAQKVIDDGLDTQAAQEIDAGI